MDEKSAYTEKAREIIDDNSYMVVCTATPEGKPWSAPVFFANDPDYREFYFISAIDSRHAEDIEANPRVALTIFDSSSPVGTSDGVQIDGTASVVEKEGINKAVKIYSDRLSKKSSSTDTNYDPEEYLAPAEFRFFEVKAQKVYVTGADRRVEVDMGK